MDTFQLSVVIKGSTPILIKQLPMIRLSMTIQMSEEDFLNAGVLPYSLTAFVFLFFDAVAGFLSPDKLLLPIPCHTCGSSGQ